MDVPVEPQYYLGGASAMTLEDKAISNLLSRHHSRGIMDLHYLLLVVGVTG